ncbi:Leucine-rich repeat transmembrane protein kinase protein, putative [Theobroma cacao]|uniref:non-specific serine/threonine protein kinase n=1 Tax=Theobroma cacao TaxID=3641 RepID=A0A061GAC3_THECC|nr:Leucine-rich repeat transmembrane protein kinase protein, putative [Theobroma cacao]
MEIYQVLDFNGSPTDPSDVDAVVAIKHAYNISRDDWQGDPCLPKEYSWNGLNCSVGIGTPRIISLSLSSSNLTGQIPLSLSKLQALESLNKLIGWIPQSLKDKSDKGLLSLSLGGNPDLCLTDPCERRKNKFAVPIVASAVSLLALVVLLSLWIIFFRLKKGRQGESVNETKKESFKTKNRPFTYSEIASITANFNTVIGQGGFGKVYSGTLNDKTKVAVKLLSESSKQGFKQFQAEAQLLMIVHHKNLVSLVGYCDEGDNLALIYEYMANGDLRKKLSVNDANVLDWKARLQIAIDTAQGLEYLHEGIKPPIVHRDLKTANILLTEKMQAKIADFGLSKVFMTEWSCL